MTAFEIPKSARAEIAAADEARCPSTAPDLWTVGCQLERGHDGMHRNNLVVWREPLIVMVGGAEPDLHVETERWRGGRVLLFDDVEPDL